MPHRTSLFRPYLQLFGFYGTCQFYAATTYHSANFGSKNDPNCLLRSYPLENSRYDLMVETRSKLRFWLLEMRIHHWVKNILVFIPASANHSIMEEDSILSGVVTFTLFSITASSIYIVNDLLDLDSDRTHPVKRFRPLAAGAIKKSHAIVVSAFMMTVVCIFSLLSCPELIAVLCLYVFLNLIYSIHLKTIPILDVIVLALMYELRIIAGGISMDIDLSNWLITSSSFFFLSMAFAKRYSELQNASSNSGFVNPRRGYKKEDIAILQNLGIASSFSSILVFSLYINDPNTSSLYSEPRVLLFLLPILSFVLCRKWLEVTRRESSEDPVVDFLKDKLTLIAVPVILLVIVIAK